MLDWLYTWMTLTEVPTDLGIREQPGRRTDGRLAAADDGGSDLRRRGGGLGTELRGEHGCRSEKGEHR
jgi:hypothetical protein